ncbi:MAG: hypothetical protein ACKVP0_25085 [Pirellulaceae bacterium]
MKLEKLVKTLHRELVANPMKTGVLGVLLLGGMYFWVPLIWKWAGNEGATVAPGAMVAPAGDSEPLGRLAASGQSGNSTAVNKEAAIGWREIRERREADPLATSADFHSEWNQKFQVSIAAPVQESRSEAEVKQPVELDPSELGMVLQGVVISPRVKKAIINGNIYREHDTINVQQNAGKSSDKGASQPDLEFRLLRVFRRMVELERGGRTWQLKLTSSDPAKTSTEAIKQTTPNPMERKEEKASSKIPSQAKSIGVEEQQ